MFELTRAHNFRPADVERIRLGVLGGGALLVADPIEQKRAPRSIVDAQFSAPYAAAAALVFGTGGIEAYSPDRLRDATVRDLMARTDCYQDPSLEVDYPRRWPAAAEVHLLDGRVLATRIEFATGEPENPVSRDALIAKFLSLAEGSVADPHALAEQLLSLDSAPDLAALTASLSD
jgi:2-methylcitrate dehydratase PrpD